MTFTVTGLPTGLSYNSTTNLINGTATVAGAWTVNVTVADGQGGSDSDSYIWRVIDPTAIVPIAEVYFGLPYLNANNASGNSLALHFPAKPLPATVVMYNPNDAMAFVPVTLAITPSGRSVLNLSGLSLRHGEAATVWVTAKAVSQRPQDVVIRAFVNGGETSRDTMTNVGLVLPLHIRAKDTPAGMKDRISIGTGKWGSYFGIVVVAPNLKGIANVSLGMKSRYCPPLSCGRL